jgi:hypothetical protein
MMEGTLYNAGDPSQFTSIHTRTWDKNIKIKKDIMG